MNKQQFKQLPFGKKIIYILRYHKADILLGGWLIFLLCSWIIQDYIRPEYMRVEMINAAENSAGAEAFAAPDAMRRSAEPVHNIILSKSIRTEENYKPWVILTQRAEWNDLYFWDEAAQRQGIAIGKLMDLREVLPADVLESCRDQLLYTDTQLNGGFPYAIHLENNAWIQKNGFYKDCMVAVPACCDDVERVADFLCSIL